MNQGELEQYLIEDNHEAIISKEDWQRVQDKLNSRRWQQGRKKTYKFTGLLKCQHCGSTLKRQVSYKKKIVWCCSKYIKEGKVACQGMRVPEVDISNWVITSPITVIERDRNGEKYYSYSGQESADQRSASGQEENQGSRIFRVSTDQEEQLSSYENQVNYYREYISKHEDYELVDIYADEGISATNTKKRDAFNRLIQDCRVGKVDRILLNQSVDLPEIP